MARIADAAKVNKQLIYFYFGDKAGLFDAVLRTQSENVSTAVPCDSGDVLGFVGRLFDYIVDNPTVMRLAAWKRLEEVHSESAAVEDHFPWTGAIEQAQLEGHVPAAYTSSNLAALLYGMASALDNVIPASDQGDRGSPQSTLRSRFREDLLTAVQRVIDVGSNGRV